MDDFTDPLVYARSCAVAKSKGYASSLCEFALYGYWLGVSLPTDERQMNCSSSTPV